MRSGTKGLRSVLEDQKNNFAAQYIFAVYKLSSTFIDFNAQRQSKNLPSLGDSCKNNLSHCKKRKLLNRFLCFCILICRGILYMTNRARLTVDMEFDEHSYLKMACAKLGMTMRQFVLLASFEKMETIEDAWLAEKAHQTLMRIESGEEKTSSWKKARERLM